MAPSTTHGSSRSASSARRYGAAVWPEPVERIATVLREAQVEGRIEELAAGEDELPGPMVRAACFQCDRRTLVVLAPADRVVDRRLVARAAGCARLEPAPLPSFPFRGTQVLIERIVLSLPLVWLQVGSPRHALGLSPGHLARLTGGESVDLLERGDVHSRPPG
jgi:prolyl-tRNA editing enzyme YbaK/EbsC (Cys-tRNA(Pro) deacylase)